MCKWSKLEKYERNCMIFRLIVLLFIQGPARKAGMAEIFLLKRWF